MGEFNQKEMTTTLFENTTLSAGNVGTLPKPPIVKIKERKFEKTPETLPEDKTFFQKYVKKPLYIAGGAAALVGILFLPKVFGKNDVGLKGNNLKGALASSKGTVVEVYKGSSPPMKIPVKNTDIPNSTLNLTYDDDIERNAIEGNTGVYNFVNNAVNDYLSKNPRLKNKKGDLVISNRWGAINPVLNSMYERPELESLIKGAKKGTLYQINFGDIDRGDALLQILNVDGKLMVLKQY